MSDKRMKVLFIAGYGRSGSSLLDCLLGQIEGFVTLGEVRHLWERGGVENQLCSCGSAFSDCEFWGSIWTAALGEDSPDPKELLRLSRQVDRKRNIPRNVIPWLRNKDYGALFSAYADKLARIYREAAKWSGGRVLVDSSKNPSHGFILSRMDEIDLHVLHLIRDPRATAYSWQRKKLRPEITGKKVYMPTIKPSRSSLEWTVLHTLVELLRSRADKYMRLKYEDFIGAPEKTLGKITDFVGESARELDFIEDNVATLRHVHSVSGNPSRFKKEPIEIRNDDEWQREMKREDRLVVNLMAWPMLLKYGYSL